MPDPHIMPAEQREAVYRTIFSRRDVRAQFLADPVPDEVLARILTAAHYAPSVGFMQPWNFIVIRSPEVKQRMHDQFLQANAEAAMMFEGDRRELYEQLKLEGIMEAPVNLCVTCDRDALYEVLDIPRQIVPVAYLCLGYVSHFKQRPELESAGWRSRLPLAPLICHERWGGEPLPFDHLNECVTDFQQQVDQGI